MSRPVLIALGLLAVLAWSPAAAFEPGESPALEQAESIGEKGAGPLYDNSRGHGAVKAKSSVTAGAEGACVDETCGFRRGGPPPDKLKKEPSTPFTGDLNPDGTKKKDPKGKFTWKTVAFTLVGGAAGAGVGFLVGGPIGAIIGGIVGALAGLLLNLFS